MDEDFEGRVGIAGEDMGAGDAEDREATNAVECGKVARIGASLRYTLAVAADLHSSSMVAAR